jgi:hypothetical protein
MIVVTAVGGVLAARTAIARRGAARRRADSGSVGPPGTGLFANGMAYGRVGTGPPWDPIERRLVSAVH